MKKYQASQRVYLKDGRASSYVCPAELGHVVEPLYMQYTEDGDDYESEGIPIFVPEVFSEAPKEIYETNLVRIKGEVSALGKKRNDLLNEIQKLKQDHTALLAKLSKHEELKHIEAFLDGKFTHAFMESYDRPSVGTFDEIMRDPDSSYKREIRLLSLFGTDHEGKLRWKRNHYYDGSGSWTQIIPCMSLEEAEDHAKKHIQSVLEKGEEYKKVKIIPFAEKFGVPVPPEILQAKLDNEEKSRQEKIAKLEAELAKVKQ